jgi:hypothetical protein
VEQVEIGLTKAAFEAKSTRGFLSKPEKGGIV